MAGLSVPVGPADNDPGWMQKSPGSQSGWTFGVAPLVLEHPEVGDQFDRLLDRVHPDRLLVDRLAADGAAERDVGGPAAQGQVAEEPADRGDGRDEGAASARRFADDGAAGA